MTISVFFSLPFFVFNVAQQQGDWWVGGAEKRPSESDPAGKQYGDSPKGTFISPCFRIVGRDISFLIGGGCPRNNIRAELIVDNQVRLFILTVMFHLILLRQPRQIYQSIRALVFQNCETILSFVISMRFL